MIKVILLVVALTIVSAQNDDSREQNMEFGAQYVARKAIEAGAVPNVTYKVAGTCEQTFYNPGRYYYYQELVGDDDTTFSALYFVGVNSDQTRQVVSYSYATTSDFNAISFVAGDASPEPYVQLDVTYLHDIDYVTDQLLQYTGEEWTPSSETDKPVTEEDFNSDVWIQFMLRFGMSSIVEAVVADPNNALIKVDFHVSQIFNLTVEDFVTSPVEGWDGDGGFVSDPGHSYTFDFELQNDQGVKLRAALTVSYSCGGMGFDGPNIGSSSYQVVDGPQI